MSDISVIQLQSVTKLLVPCIVKQMTPARQRLGKHCLKAGIMAEAKVNLLGNDTCFHGNGC
jgi:hypothetical protein